MLRLGFGNVLASESDILEGLVASLLSDQPGGAMGDP
jgi:hypothetical protein